MRSSINNYKRKDWARAALKLGLVLTAPKVWNAISDQLNNHVDDVSSRLSRGFDDVSDTAGRTYDKAVDRLSAASDALQGRNSWAAPLTGLVIGIGVGAGLGILLAPAPGSETREALRDRAVQAKNKVVQSATNARDSVRQSIPFTATGTEGV